MDDELAWTDEQQMLAVQKGNTSAFDALYNKYYPILVAFFRQLACCWDYAGELADDVLLKVLDKRMRFDPGQGTFRQWVFKIAVNRRFDFLRYWSRQLRVMLLDSVGEALIERHTDQTPTVEVQLQVKECLERLSAPNRRVLVLLFLQGFTEDETATILNKSAASVRRLKERALEQCERVLGGGRRSFEAKRILERSRYDFGEAGGYPVARNSQQQRHPSAVPSRQQNPGMPKLDPGSQGVLNSVRAGARAQVPPLHRNSGSLPKEAPVGSTATHD